MNHDEKFQQKWEFRRADDGDSSSDDSKSRSSGDNNHNIVSYDLVLLDNEELISHTPRSRQNDKLETKKKLKSSNKKKKRKKNTNAAPNKSKRCLLIKESQKRKRPNLESKEMVMFEDLRTFAGSLIHELKLAREDMSAWMRQETGKLVKKKAKSCKNKKVKPERSMKSIVTSNTSDYSKAVVKHDRVLEPKKTDPMTLATNSVVIPKPHLHRNSILSNDHKDLGLDAEIAKMMHGFPALRQEVQFGGFRGQNCSENVGFGFPVPLHQGLGYSSNMLSQICENSFKDKSKINLRRTNGGNPAISEYVLANGINSDVHRTGGGFASLRSQDVQLYMASLRNNSK